MAITGTPAFMSSYGYDPAAGIAGLTGPDVSMADIGTYINSSKTAQIGTIVVATATNSYAYTVTINEVDITYTADSSTSLIEIAAGLAAAINAEPRVSGDVRAVSDGVDTVTVTSRIAGLAFTMTDNGEAKLTTTEASTASADAVRIPFGAGVVSNGVGKCRLATGSRTAAVSAVAQVSHATPTAVNSVRYLLGVRMLSGTYEGEIYMSSVVADGSATVQEIVEAVVAALNALLPANTVAATEDNTKVILTAEVAGVGFEVLVGNESTNVWTIAESVANVTAAAAYGTLTGTFLGAAVRSHIADERDSYNGSSADGASWPPDANVAVLRRRSMWVRIAADDTDFSSSSGVYLTISDSGSGDAGDFRSDYDTGYAALLSNCRWASELATDPDGNPIALLEID